MVRVVLPDELERDEDRGMLLAGLGLGPRRSP